MSLSVHDIAVLDSLARDVGSRIGWELHFLADADSESESAGLTAGARRVFVVGPVQLTELVRADVEAVLDELARGMRRITDEIGDPYMV